MKLHMSLFFIGCISSLLGFAQKGVTTFGVQLKPVVPWSLVGTGDDYRSGRLAQYALTPELGFNFGMVMRFGFTDRISLETGINAARRNYRLAASEISGKADLTLNNTFVAYEIPLLGMVYVQLGDQLWMNGAAGFSFDLYPSDTYTQDYIFVDSEAVEMQQEIFRYRWLRMALLVNYGFEYRTKKAGYYYLGVSYHRPFQDMAISESILKVNQEAEVQTFILSGNYLSIDLRYFFHEDPEKKTKKKKK